MNRKNADINFYFFIRNAENQNDIIK
jgi:hypothetical protein